MTVSTSLTVEPLARHRHLLPLVREWFVGEWPAWYGAGGPGDILRDLEAFAASEVQLPVGFVVFTDSNPIGAAALKSQSIPTHMHLTPWAAAGYVMPEHRGCGIGAALLTAMVSHARELGFPQTYCGTSTADTLLRRCGWSSLEVIEFAGKPLTIFRSAT